MIFDAIMYGTSPEPRRCETHAELAEWFRAFALAMAVRRMARRDYVAFIVTVRR